MFVDKQGLDINVAAGQVAGLKFRSITKVPCQLLHEQLTESTTRETGVRSHKLASSQCASNRHRSVSMRPRLGVPRKPIGRGARGTPTSMN